MNITLTRYNQRKVAQRFSKALQSDHRRNKRKPLPYVFVGFLVMALIAFAAQYIPLGVAVAQVASCQP